MTNRNSIPRRPRPSEEGYMLVAVMFMLVILLISLSIAIPRIRAEIQRDRELETMQRGKQYIRAIKMYYKKFGAYPPSMDALTNTVGIRFLRQKYKDPTTGKQEWKPIHFGENKAPTAMGFFGQPLLGGATAGGPDGVNPITGGTTNTPGIGGTTGSSTIGASTIGAGTSTTPPDPNAPAGSTTDPTGIAAANGPTGPTFGGGGIIGFSPGSPKQSILFYKKKNHYNEWEFVYDPMTDRGMMPGIPQQPIQPGAPGMAPPLAPTAPTTPTTPTTP